MEKPMPMCRICLAENVSMYIVVNKSLHELYERLTDIPFVTEDSRPILACSFCCIKLKQCFRLMRKCLEAEELFAQMMNEDYEPNPSINPDRLEFYGGLVKTEIQTISIVDVDQTESIVVKEELPTVCERLDDIIEIKEDFQSYDIKQENLDSGDLDREGEVIFPPLYFEDDIPLLEVEIEVEKVEEVSKQKLQAGETYRSTVTKKPKLTTRGTKIEDVKAVKQKKNVLAVSNFMQNTEIHTFQEPFSDSKPSIDIFNNNNNFVEENNSRKRRNRGDLTCKRRKKENSHKCDICQRCFSHKGHLTRHMFQHTGEKPYKCEICHRSFTQLSNLKRHVLTHSGEKPYKCDLCQCSYIDMRDLTKHILLHAGEKPFKCDICRFSCNDKRELTKHVRKHTGQKSVCEICQQSFSFASDLKKHIRIHTGEKPYICDICHRGFNVKSNLTKHILAHSERHYVI